jgi:hypothetical protein
MFWWSYLDASGDEMGRSGRFPDAESAEEWMRTCWADLVGCGVEEVVLYDHSHGRRMYRMGIGAE